MDLAILRTDLAPAIASHLGPQDVFLAMQCCSQWRVAWAAQLAMVLKFELALVGATQSVPQLLRMYRCCWPDSADKNTAAGTARRQGTLYMPAPAEWGLVRSKAPEQLRFGKLQLIVQLFECQPQDQAEAEYPGDLESRSEGRFLCSLVVPVDDSPEDGVAPAIFTVTIPPTRVSCARDPLSLLHAQLYVLDCTHNDRSVELLSESCESRHGQPDYSSSYGSRYLCESVTVGELTRSRSSKYSIYDLQTPLREKRLMEVGWIVACNGNLETAARGVECSVDIWADFSSNESIALERIDLGFFSQGPQGVTPYPLTRYEFLQNLEELDWCC